MNLYTDMRHRSYFKVERNTLDNFGLSEGAQLMYVKLCAYKGGYKKYKTALYKELGLSKNTYERRKKELRDAGLLLIKQTGIRQYELYLGNSLESAEEHYHRVNLTQGK